MALFRHGSEYEEIIETAAGAFWIVAQVSIRGTELQLHDLLFYPATATRQHVGYSVVRGVFRHIEAVARAQGFTACRLNASRAKGAKPRRMLSVRKTL